MSTILLAGGAGFIGSNLAREHVRRGDRVIVYDRPDARWENLAPLGDRCRTLRGDLRDGACLEALFSEERVDLVVFLASTIVPGAAIDAGGDVIRDDLAPLAGLLAAMRRHGVGRIVFLSSGGTVYGLGAKVPSREGDPTRPLNLYGWLKLAGEQYVELCQRHYGLEYQVLRPSNAYGWGQRLSGNQGIIPVAFGRILRGEPLEIWGDGSAVRDYLFVDDLVRAIVDLGRQGGWNEVYNVGSGVGTTLREVLELVQAVSGRPLSVRYAPARNVDLPASVLDVSKLERTIAWEGLVPLRVGLERFWRALAPEGVGR